MKLEPRALLLLAGAALAAPEVRVSPGFEQYVVPERAIPLRCEVTAPDAPVGGALRVVARLDEAGFPLHVDQLRLDVPAGGSKVSWLTVWPDQILGGVRLWQIDDRGRRTELIVPVRALPRDERLLVVVNPTRSGLRFLRRERQPEEGQPAPITGRPPTPGLTVANIAAEELPPVTAAYEAVDTLVLATDDITGGDPRVREALAGYVRQGGQLVLCGGPAAAGLWADPHLGPLAPVEVSGLETVTVDDLRELRRFGRSWPAGGRFAISRGRLRAGQVLAGSADRPLWASVERGRGRVVYVACPLDQPPLAGWDGEVAFWRAVIDRPAAPPPRDLALSWSLPRNIAVLAPSVKTPVAGLIVGFLALYLIVLVPLQFPLLARLGRRELAWVTTPLIALAFSAAAYGLGVSLKGRRVILHSAALVDLTSGQREGFGLSATALFSPAKRTYHLRLPATTLRVAELDDNLEGRGWGWSSADNALARRGTLTVTQSSEGFVIDELPVNMWAMRLIGLAGPVDLEGVLTVDGRRRDGRYVGRVHNGLRWPLRGVQAVVSGGVTTIGEIAPGATAAFDDRHLTESSEALVNELTAKLTELPLDNFLLTDAAGALQRLLASPTSEHRPPPLGVTADTPAIWGWVEREGAPVRVEGVDAAGRQLLLVRVALPPESGP